MKIQCQVLGQSGADELEVDENLLGYPVKAMIGCNISSKQRETILEDIENIEEIREIIEITGRFDVLIWISAKSLDDLYELVSKKLPKKVNYLEE